MGDQGSKRGTIKSPEEIMAHGGCKVANAVHENGQEWHPYLPSHGEQKCIKCRCKVSSSWNFSPIFSQSNQFDCQFQDSVIKCDRKRCVRSACNKNAARNRANGFTPAQQHHELNGSSNGNDECCSAQCRRARRHQNQKQRMHRDRNDRPHKSSAHSKS